MVSISATTGTSNSRLASARWCLLCNSLFRRAEERGPSRAADKVRTVQFGAVVLRIALSQLDAKTECKCTQRACDDITNGAPAQGGCCAQEARKAAHRRQVAAA